MLGSFVEKRVGAIDVVKVDDGLTQRLLSGSDLVSGTGAVAVAWPTAHAIWVARTSPRQRGAILEVPVDDRGGSAGAVREVHETLDGEIENMKAARGGESALVVVARDEHDVYTGTLANDATRLTEPLRLLTADDANDWAAAVLDDGRTLFASDRAGTFGAYAQRSRESLPERLKGDVRSLERQHDGDVLGWSGDDSECRVVRLAGTEWETLFVASPGDDSLECWASIRCARRDLCVTFRQLPDEGVWSRFDLTTGRRGAKVCQTPGRIRSWDLSPSGASLVFTTYQFGFDAPLSFASLSTGEIRQVYTTPRFLLQDVTFLPQGQALLLTGMGDGEWHYVLYESDLGGHGRRLAGTADRWFGSVAVSGNGRRIAVTEKAMPMSLWMVDVEGKPGGRDE